jgi:hypothetical protein
LEKKIKRRFSLGSGLKSVGPVVQSHRASPILSLCAPHLRVGPSCQLVLLPYLFSASPTDREAGGARGKFSGEISAPAKSGAVAWATQDRVSPSRREKPGHDPLLPADSFPIKSSTATLAQFIPWRSYVAPLRPLLSARPCPRRHHPLCSACPFSTPSSRHRPRLVYTPTVESPPPRYLLCILTQCASFGNDVRQVLACAFSDLPRVIRALVPGIAHRTDASPPGRLNSRTNRLRSRLPV